MPTSSLLQQQTSSRPPQREPPRACRPRSQEALLLSSPKQAMPLLFVLFSLVFLVSLTLYLSYKNDNPYAAASPNIRGSSVPPSISDKVCLTEQHFVHSPHQPSISSRCLLIHHHGVQIFLQVIKNPTTSSIIPTPGETASLIKEAPFSLQEVLPT